MTVFNTDKTINPHNKTWQYFYKVTRHNNDMNVTITSMTIPMISRSMSSTQKFKHLNTQMTRIY